MAFSKPTQPGQTQYPNLLPVQAYGYPDGSLLALLSMDSKRSLERVLDETGDEYADRLLLSMQAYQDAVAKDVRNPEKDLATFLLKKPEIWVWHKRIFSDDCDNDFEYFTILAAKAYQGDFLDEQGVPYDPEMVKAIWAIAARALGVIQQPALVGVGDETT